MRAITLYQPWAMLIALLLKLYETRGVGRRRGAARSRSMRAWRVPTGTICNASWRTITAGNIPAATVRWQMSLPLPDGTAARWTAPQ